MGIVLAVTRNPTIAMTLAGSGHDVRELRPGALETWLQHPDRPQPDSVLIALPTPQDALGALYLMRDHGVGSPALLLAAGEAWADVDPAAPGGLASVRLLALPVVGTALIAAVNEVQTLPSAYVGSHVAIPEPEPEPEPVIEPDAESTPAVAHIIDLRAGEGEDGDLAAVRASVSQLLSRVGDVYGVAESAAVVVTEARSRTKADAAAILIADGERWRPTAFEGVREDEHGDVLPGSSWVATTMTLARRGLVIDNSELARERLVGAPLAGRRHLLVAPVQAARAALIVARDEDPGFDEDDVNTLVALAAEAGPVLSAAVDARALARALAPLRDLGPVPDRVDTSG